MRSISASTSAISFRAAGGSVSLGCCAHTPPPSDAAAMVVTAAAILVFIRRDLLNGTAKLQDDLFMRPNEDELFPGFTRQGCSRALGLIRSGLHSSF